MLRPKIFSMLWKTWVAYGLPHGFVRHDKILPIQPPNLKKKRLSSKTDFFQDANSAMYFYQHAATRSHSQPLEWPQVALSGRSTLVASSGRKWPLPASGRKWPQVATFCDFNFHPQSNLPGFLQNRKDFEAC